MSSILWEKPSPLFCHKIKIKCFFSYTWFYPCYLLSYCCNGKFFWLILNNLFWRLLMCVFYLKNLQAGIRLEINSSGNDLIWQETSPESPDKCKSKFQLKKISWPWRRATKRLEKQEYRFLLLFWTLQCCSSEWMLQPDCEFQDVGVSLQSWF